MTELAREKRLEAALAKAQRRYDEAVRASTAYRHALAAIIEHSTVALERERELLRQQTLARRNLEIAATQFSGTL